jgi:hypothetical protein
MPTDLARIQIDEEHSRAICAEIGDRLRIALGESSDTATSGETDRKARRTGRPRFPFDCTIDRKRVSRARLGPRIVGTGVA